jgi:hypothetical protein
MSTTEPTTEFEEPWPNYSTPQSKALMANESWGRTGFAFYHKANRREMAEALERVERQAGEAALSQFTPERIRKAWIATGASWCSLDRAQRVYAALTEKPQEPK